MQAMCSLDVQGPSAMELAEAFIDDSRESPATAAAAKTMLRAALAARDRVDELLVGEVRHWDLGRMALVARNILRLAGWELLEGRTGHGVVIDHALRLAEEFSTTDAVRFINGVLDAVARRLRERSAPQGQAAASGQD